MKKLIRGILDFRKNVLPGRREVFAKLAAGQAPDVLLISCSDSRVAPNWFASTDPGDLFVVRNVGNLVPPCDQAGDSGSDHSVAAAIEFALLSLNVSDIVVCGHSGCGAIHALAEGVEKLQPLHLRHWVGFAQPSVQKPSLSPMSDLTLSEEDQLSQKNVLQQIEHLKTYPEIRKRLQKKTLRLHAWWFNIAQGGIYAYEANANRFALIDDAMAASLLED